LLEHGDADRLSIRAVTAGAGVSPTALYLQFAGMEELLQAVSDEAFEDLGDYMRAALEGQGEDPDARLQAIGEAYVRFAEQRPGHYRILFATPGRDGRKERVEGRGRREGGLRPVAGEHRRLPAAGQRPHAGRPAAVDHAARVCLPPRGDAGLPLARRHGLRAAAAHRTLRC